MKCIKRGDVEYTTYIYFTCTLVETWSLKEVQEQEVSTGSQQESAWTTHEASGVEKTTCLPDKLIRKAKGKTAFEETFPRVLPISTFPAPVINNISQNLVILHSTEFNGEEILMQRHQVQIVPITQVTYNHENKSGDYFVYGLERKIHAPDFPTSCSIL
ncbi:hypothetical protein RRG08_045986 [Elysia crispata]|uniref:Uncharacterized protein n=1 Tax=Elysia crispata TaxID=231223 RepID=A0AAE0YZV4_9GAST|nr:hypothetical protein RRG08_045986 [Elysia crispata]